MITQDREAVFRRFTLTKRVKGGDNLSITSEDIELGMAEWLAQGNTIEVLPACGTGMDDRRASGTMGKGNIKHIPY